MPETADPLAERVRACLRRMASTVTILSAGQGRSAVVMTATAFTSVSLEPTPTVLVCINRSARLHAAVTRVGGFRVNGLSDSQAATARTCGGGDMEARLRAGPWQDDQFGPRLADGLFDLACRTLRIVDQGAHSIFIGEVLDARSGHGEPLLYLRGSYAQPVQLAATPALQA